MIENKESLENKEESEKVKQGKKVLEAFLQSDEFKQFFPDQLITYQLFEFPKVIIQTILAEDEEKLKQNFNDKSITSIEYKVDLNFIADSESVGPQEETDAMLQLNVENPFKISIITNGGPNGTGKISDELEYEYLEKFRNVFIKLLELIIENFSEEDMEKIKKYNIANSGEEKVNENSTR